MEDDYGAENDVDDDDTYVEDLEEIRQENEIEIPENLLQISETDVEHVVGAVEPLSNDDLHGVGHFIAARDMLRRLL